MTSKTVVPMEPARSLQHLQRPEAWATWPWCPVKRWKNGVQELGLVLAGEIAPGMGACVHLCNLFDAAEVRRAAPRKGYASVNDLVADGWRVD